MPHTHIVRFYKLVNATTHITRNQSQIQINLRVNPRNPNPLENVAILVAIPEGFDGETAKLSCTGGSENVVSIAHNWDLMKRLLSWTPGQLESGAMLKFQVSIASIGKMPEQKSDDDKSANKFPILMSYESQGSLLSSINLDLGDVSGVSIKQGYRVYHREI